MNPNRGGRRSHLGPARFRHGSQVGFEHEQDANSIVAAVVALVAASAPAAAQTGGNPGAANGQTQAQAELDSAIEEVRSDVAHASADFSSDSTPTLAATASKFASDTLTVSNGLAAVQTYADSVVMPAVEVGKLAAQLQQAHAEYQRASAIDANSRGSNDCEQIARRRPASLPTLPER
jgi:hypothetical protein